MPSSCPGAAPAGVHSIKLRSIMRWDPSQRRLRLMRLLWNRGAWGFKDERGRCVPYSFALTISLRPALFSFRREDDQVRLTVLGLAINYHRSAGGQIV